MKKLKISMALLGILALTACGGGEAPTNPPPVTTPTAPVAPATVTATLSGATVTVRWTAVANATSYVVERRNLNGSYTTVTSTAGLEATDTLTAGGSYAYRVKALNAQGESAWTTSNTVTFVVQAPGNLSKTKAEALLGTWTFTYTIQSTFTDTFRFVTVMPNDYSPNEYFAGGYDQWNSPVVGWWDLEESTYVVGNGSEILPQLFLFTAIDNNTVSGCMTAKVEGIWSRCYPFVGRRVSSAASLNTVSPASAQAAYQIFKKAADSR